MRYQALLAITGAALSTTAEARRWRFAVPFPGKIEPSVPEPVHKAYEHMEEKEKLFDTKQVSRRTQKPKIAVEEKKPNGKFPEEEVAPRIPWML